MNTFLFTQYLCVYMQKYASIIVHFEMAVSQNFCCRLSLWKVSHYAEVHLWYTSLHSVDQSDFLRWVVLPLEMWDAGFK